MKKFFKKLFCKHKFIKVEGLGRVELQKCRCGAFRKWDKELEMEVY
jgi:hypothetical protein|tara:strand:- start:4890 stop:5027 length:138 start_codon:yes stop_codon:yes gene_type:complete